MGNEVNRPRSRQATEGVEEVLASEIVVGDRLFFPNRARAQVVVQVVVTGSEESPIRQFQSGDAMWQCPADHPVRREVS